VKEIVSSLDRFISACLSSITKSLSIIAISHCSGRSVESSQKKELYSTTLHKGASFAT